MITIEARATGARRELAPQWQVPIEDVGGGGSPLTLRLFIERVVRAEVGAFRERQARQRFVEVLTRQAIEDRAERGRVTFADTEVEAQDVDADDAVATALEAFDDGLYFVLIDGREYRSLDEQVAVAADSKVTFLRLVALAGG
jgi:hypothetical protein